MDTNLAKRRKKGMPPKKMMMPMMKGKMPMEAPDADEAPPFKSKPKGKKRGGKRGGY